MRLTVAGAVLATATMLASVTNVAEASTPVPYYPVRDAGPRGTGHDEPSIDSRTRMDPEARFVAFGTRSPLVNDTDTVEDVYVHDMLTGAYERVSVPTDGGTTNDADTSKFDMSSDGRYIAFATTSSHFTAGPGVYVRDRAFGSTSLVAAGSVRDVAMSLDGDFVAYSLASTGQVFVVQRSTSTSTEVAVPSPAGPLSTSFDLSLSVGGTRLAVAASVLRTVGGSLEANARVLVFDKSPSGLSYSPHDFGGPIPGGADLTASGQEPGSHPGGGSTRPSLSADGRYLTFVSEFGDLVDNDTNGAEDIFFRDLGAPGIPLQRISLSATGSEIVGGYAEAPMITADGRYVAFTGGDGTNGYFGSPCVCSQVVLWDRDAPASSKITNASRSWNGSFMSSYSEDPAVSVDGRFIAYATDSLTVTPTVEPDGPNLDLVILDRSASYVDTTVTAGGTAQTQTTVDATHPVGMRVTSPSGGHVLLTKARRRLTVTQNAIPVDVTFQAFLPSEPATAPATISIGLDGSQSSGSSGFGLLKAFVDGTVVPACASGALPPATATCQKPVVVNSDGIRQIDLLTTGTPGDEIDIAWTFGSPPPPPNDTTAPTVTLTTPPLAPGTATYALNAVVAAAYTCADDVALASCVGTVAAGTAIDTSTPGTHSFSVTATDVAGHVTVVQTSYEVLDQVVSSVTAGQVTTVSTGATPTPADPLETSLTTSSAGNGGTVSLTEGPADQPALAQYSFLDFQVAIVAPDGTAAAPLTIVFALDGSLLTPAGLDYLTVQITRNGTPLGSCSTTPMPCVALREALSGNGARITVNAVSASKWNFGRRAAFTLGGFVQPVDNPPTINKAKAGSAVPVKFSLSGFQGMSVIADTYPRSSSMSCSSTATVDALESTASPGASTLSYDATTDLYTYVWKTDKSWTGCRTLTIKFAEGSVRTALFQFTK